MEIVEFTCTVPSGKNTRKPGKVPGPHSTAVHPTQHSHVISGAGKALHPHVPVTFVPSAKYVRAGRANGIFDQAANSDDAKEGICSSMAESLFSLDGVKWCLWL